MKRPLSRQSFFELLRVITDRDVRRALIRRQRMKERLNAEVERASA